jgi:hypothetical protein
MRAMYQGGRADPVARRLSAIWAAVFRFGIAPRRWVTLEVSGRQSGRLTRFPLGMSDVDGHWYLVPMLGADCNWVRNVRAAGGEAVVRRRRVISRQLIEVPVAERPPVIRRYLEKVPGGRPHIPVDRNASSAELAAIAPLYPVFKLVPLGSEDPQC